VVIWLFLFLFLSLVFVFISVLSELGIQVLCWIRVGRTPLSLSLFYRTLSFLHHEGMLNFVKGFFLHVLRWCCDFFPPWLYLYTILHLICICWAILSAKEWNQLYHVIMFLCVVKIQFVSTSLRVFGYMSIKEIGLLFSFLLCPYHALVSGQYWIIRTSLLQCSFLFYFIELFE
jgi:hypothetical protein